MESILPTLAMGLGTVFVGLIALIFIIMIMSAIVNVFVGKKKVPDKSPEPTAVAEDGIQNRQEFIAAVSAALATVMGKEITGLRIKSIKKI